MSSIITGARIAPGFWQRHQLHLSDPADGLCRTQISNVKSSFLWGYSVVKVRLLPQQKGYCANMGEYARKPYYDREAIFCKKRS